MDFIKIYKISLTVKFNFLDSQIKIVLNTASFMPLKQ